MCAKLIHHAGISRVIVVGGGYAGENCTYLTGHGVEVVHVDGPQARAYPLSRRQFEESPRAHQGIVLLLLERFGMPAFDYLFDRHGSRCSLRIICCRTEAQVRIRTMSPTCSMPSGSH